jgi:phosphoribosyl-ATP pyrophosphohydrolase/phosphoribosyl-AMP cyclohydrolase
MIDLACAAADRERAAEGAADLVYHALVALRATGAGWNEVRRVLAARLAARAEDAPPR